jgi:hypothetical protein
MCETFQWLFGYLVLPFAVSAYASVIVSRAYQFYDAKKDAWEIIITMEHELECGAGTLKHPRANARLNSATQRIRYFGHLAAASQIDEIARDIEEKLKKAETELSGGVVKVQIPRDAWERRIVALRYNWLSIFKPWPVRF